MIDKNGKLFGKLNIIDLLIILIVIAAIIFVGLRFFGGNDNDLGTLQKVRMTFFADEAPAFLAGKAAPGDPVVDYDNTYGLGIVSSYETEDAFVYDLDPVTGEVVQVPVANACRLTFSCETYGYLAADGLRIDGYIYSIGGSHTIRAGQMRVACRLADIEVIG